MIFYRDLSPVEAVSAVAPEALSLARRVAEIAAEQLGIKTPALIWFEKSHVGFPGAYKRAFDMKGEARALSADIRLFCGLTGEDLANTIAHEAKHLHQFERGMLSRIAPLNTATDNAIAEADARAFAERFVAKFYGKPVSAESQKESPRELLRDLQRAMRTLEG